MIDPTRVRALNERPIRAAPRAAYVLYWMQQSQRATFNHALEYAAEQANALGLPLLVAFGLMDDYPEANERHYAFMLQGLRDVAADLTTRRIAFVVRHGSPSDVAVKLSRDAALVVCDRGYLRIQRRWRDDVADRAGCAVIEVESDAVVPVEVASDKQEFAARTIRPKILRQRDAYLVPVKAVKLKVDAAGLPVKGDFDPADVDGTLKRPKLDRSVPRSTHFEGGSREAGRRLAHFVRNLLPGYAEGRNEPAAAQSSALAAYLHFGQVSPLQMALAAVEAKGAPAADRDAFLEELIVRRELAINFCYHCPNYDAYECLPAWARKTLEQRRGDARYHVYARAELEAADTHDPYWNAAQREMNLTGFMHNYMRMYWGKKILEWTPSPQEAYETTLYLNNKLFLCGRDPNAYANVAWIFGLHDRPWGPARPVFGTVRYMNAAGLARKFDMAAYVRKWGSGGEGE